MTAEVQARYDGVLYLADQESKSKGNTLVLKNGERVESDERFSSDELRAHLQTVGTHIYSGGNIVYANARFVALTAKDGGRVLLTMPFVCVIKAFSSGAEYEGKDFAFDMQSNQTELFEIIRR